MTKRIICPVERSGDIFRVFSKNVYKGPRNAYDGEDQQRLQITN